MKRGKERPEWQKAILFLLLMALCFLIGSGLGHLTARVSLSGLDAAGWLETLVPAMPPVIAALFAAVNALALLLSLSFYLSTRRQVANWDGEDEEIDRTERRLDKLLLIVNLCIIINFLLFSAAVEIGEHTEVSRAWVTLCVGLFFFGLALFITFTKLVVDLRKRLNPEKRGSVFDLRFQKDWEASCDEAEKLLLYRAGYRAYRAGGVACLVLWLLSFFGQTLLHCGLYPSLTVCIIWLVLELTAALTELKEKRSA